MNRDDIIYISLLIGSIPIGFLFKLFDLNPKTKATVSALIGFLMVFIVCFGDIVHSLILVLVNTTLLFSIHPKYVPYFSFVWSFGYLLFFRLIEYFNLPKPCSHSNAVQLLLTLKTVGLAFEIHDTYMRKRKLIKLNEQIVLESNNNNNDNNKNNNNNNADLLIQLNPNDKLNVDKLKLEIEYLSIDPKPTILEIFFYSYCYIGILTGPYFKYRTYRDWLHIKTSSKENVDTLEFISKRGRILPLIIIAFLVLSRFISFKDATNEEFYENPLWYRLLYMPLIFTLFRFRFYIAWSFAEISCIAATFGLYPSVSKPKPGAGPTDLFALKQFDPKVKKENQYDFKTVHNIDEYKCETALTVKEVLHYWNMTVQYWMANYVYKRISFKPAGQPITMAVSAYWHGLLPGYYLSMLTTSPCILAENLMEKGFKLRYLHPRYYYLYDFGTWLFRTRLFDYMSIGFILLSYELTVKFWMSVYFIGHLTCLFFIILGYCLIKFSKKPLNKSSANHKHNTENKVNPTTTPAKTEKLKE